MYADAITQCHCFWLCAVQLRAERKAYNRERCKIIFTQIFCRCEFVLYSGAVRLLALCVAFTWQNSMTRKGVWRGMRPRACRVWQCRSGNCHTGVSSTEPVYKDRLLVPRIFDLKVALRCPWSLLTLCHLNHSFMTKMTMMNVLVKCVTQTSVRA